MSSHDTDGPRPRHESGRTLKTGEPMETFDENRRCTVEGCDARLSRYNPSDTCSLHAGWADSRVRAPYGG